MTAGAKGAGRGTRILVAGIGNVFFGDDGFGVALAQRLLAGDPLPKGARAKDFGIGGIHLAYELLDGCDALVLLDAKPLDDAAGTLALLDLGSGSDARGGERAPGLEGHLLNVDVVLELMATLGAHVARRYLVACQPASVLPSMALSDEVAGVLGDAEVMVRALVDDLLQEFATTEVSYA